MARHQHENKGRKAEATRSKSEDRPNHRQRTQREVEDIEERSTPPTPIIYEVIRKLGEEEMGRPVTSLWWSGLAAGLSISFSLLAQAILETHLPDVAWRSLVSSFWLFGRFHNGGAFAPAILHGKHTHRGPAGYGRTYSTKFGADRADLDDRPIGKSDRNAVSRRVLHIHARAHTRTARRHDRDQP